MNPIVPSNSEESDEKLSPIIVIEKAKTVNSPNKENELQVDVVQYRWIGHLANVSRAITSFFIKVFALIMLLFSRVNRNYKVKAVEKQENCEQQDTNPGGTKETEVDLIDTRTGQKLIGIKSNVNRVPGILIKDFEEW